MLPENPFIISVLIEDVVVDFLLTIPGYEELIIKRSIQIDIRGKQIRICSAEDLVIQKVIAGRVKDWDDVKALLIEQKNRLDENYVVDWLKQFADVLENPDIFTKYKEITESIRTS